MAVADRRAARHPWLSRRARIETAIPDSVAIINTIRSAVARDCAFIASPIRGGDRTVALHDGLTRQALVAVQAALLSHPDLDGCRRREADRPFDHANAAARADAHPAAGVADRHAGPPRHIEQRLVRLRLGLPADRGEGDAHWSLILSEGGGRAGAKDQMVTSQQCYAL